MCARLQDSVQFTNSYMVTKPWRSTERGKIAQRQWTGPECHNPHLIVFSNEMQNFSQWSPSFWSKIISNKVILDCKLTLVLLALTWLFAQVQQGWSLAIQAFWSSLCWSFYKEFQIGHLKPLEASRASQELTTRYHPCFLYIHIGEFLSSQGTQSHLSFLDLPRRDLPYSPIRLGTL